MKRALLCLFLVVGLGSAFAQTSSTSITVKEVDGSPSVKTKTIKVSNGTLTANGDGSVTILTGGGGGGSQTPWASDIDAAGNSLQNAKISYSRIEGPMTNAAATEISTTTLTASGGNITLSYTNGGAYRYTLTADTTVILGNATGTNRSIALEVYPDGTHVLNFPAAAVALTATNQPFAVGRTTIYFSYLDGTNYVEVSPAPSTGTGKSVNQTSPTLVTPTIASLVNAQHNHQDAAGGGALDAAAVTTGVFPIGRLATGTPDGTKFVADDGTLKTPAGGGGVGYSIKFGGSDSTANPSSGGFTTYIGSSTYIFNSTFANVKVPVPKSGTIKRIWLRVNVTGTLGSNEDVTHKISIGGAAGTGTGVTIKYNSTTQTVLNSTESVAVSAGDEIALVSTSPTWATPPTQCQFECFIWIE